MDDGDYSVYYEAMGECDPYEDERLYYSEEYDFDTRSNGCEITDLPF